MSELNEPTATPLLSAVEARVMGCLIEKEATTPEQYPLTENSLTLACNQKTSRDPVLELTPGEVGHALRQLEPRRLVRSVHGSRAQRYEHRFAEHFGITSPQQALLAVLMLRGPQTAGELLQRCERLHRFADIDDLVHQLDRLAAKTPALVLRLPKAPGQREERYAHLLCGDIDVEALSRAAATTTTSPARGALEARIEALEQRVAELEARLAGSG
jgi:hypothetical protein